MPPAIEQQEITELYREAMQAGSSAELIGPSNRLHKLPPVVFDSLLRVLEDLSEAKVSVLTTTQAAKRLGVSRQHLVDLLESGAIPFHKSGSHRRVLARDVEAYLREARRQRRILDEMARDAVELGIYDIVPDDLTAP